MIMYKFWPRLFNLHPKARRSITTTRRVLVLVVCFLLDVNRVRHFGTSCSFQVCEALAYASSIMFKSKETFKLAEIQHLEALLQTQSFEYSFDPTYRDDSDGNQHPGDQYESKDNGTSRILLRYHLNRLLVDRATGSSIFRLDLQMKKNGEDRFSVLEPNFSRHLSPTVEADLQSEILSLSSLQRCDWIGYILEEGHDASQLVQNLKSNDSTRDVKQWCLDYAKFVGKMESTTKKANSYTKKTLLCAIAHEIPSQPSLNPSLAEEDLLIVDTTSSDSLTKLFLVRLIDHRAKREEMISLKNLGWAQRPFQYSSAINTEVAEMIMDVIVTLCNSKGDGRESYLANPTMLDPTCGSGTFLALGIAKGFHVEGVDINTSVIDGAVRNLKYLYGAEKVEKYAKVKAYDSCQPLESPYATNVSCVIANLPWGRNSVLYVDENKRIVQSIRSQISANTPCVFITRPTNSEEEKGPMFIFEDSGFQVLGQAFVPQRNFLLPVSKKRSKNPTVGDRRSSTSTRDSNQCVITVAVATDSK